MTKEYLIERLKEADKYGWKLALATIEDDIAEEIIEPPGDEDEWN